MRYMQNCPGRAECVMCTRLELPYLTGSCLSCSFPQQCVTLLQVIIYRLYRIFKQSIFKQTSLTRAEP